MLPVVLTVIVLGLQGIHLHASAPSLAAGAGDDDLAPSPTLQDARRFFYNGQYDAAAAATLALCAARLEDLAACELRTSTLLFQIKTALGEHGGLDRTAAWKQCTTCPVLSSAFVAETVRAQALARARPRSISRMRTPCSFSESST